MTPAGTAAPTTLDRQEDGHLDLIGDPEWPKDKISQRLRQIRDERQHLQRQLANTDNPQINASREAIEILLDLLNDPREIYRLASKRARRSSTRHSSSRCSAVHRTLRLPGEPGRPRGY